jgi:hypothetical protein
MKRKGGLQVGLTAIPMVKSKGILYNLGEEREN